MGAVVIFERRWRDWGKIIGREKSKNNGGEKREAVEQGARGCGESFVLIF